ncbi:heme-thiolate peroxidase [Stylonectria norvegica]|nr:heme-thiolate peroxidase [Stylonectria norvegica]
MASSTASSTASLTSCPLKKGVYSHSGPSDIRSPCPLINSLANHGYIPRDGRNVRASELTAAMNEVGLSSALGAVFSHPIFNENNKAFGQNLEAPKQPRSFFGNVWYLFRNPWAALFSAFAMRKPGQEDSAGTKCINIDQLGLPGVVEHDISLTRRDHQQGDNITLQPDLVRDLLASSTDGKTLTAADLAALRRRRIDKQHEVNPGLYYGPLQHQIACTEIALVLDVFGDGDKVRCDYARAFFQEERLPIEEGWKRRRWWSLGFLELGKTVMKVKKLVGVDV